MGPSVFVRFNSRITGRIRFRIKHRWFGKPYLIPQREIEYDYVNMYDKNQPPIIAYKQSHWYDMNVDVLSSRRFEIVSEKQVNENV